jgi:phosphatidylinositol alpha-mannosyltransferase
MFPVGDAGALAATLDRLLADPAAQAALAGRAREVVAGYDWPVVAARVLEVYAMAIEATEGVIEPGDLG